MNMPISVHGLLPHKSPILMVKEIISYDDTLKKSVITAVVKNNSPFVNACGKIENECFLEIIAQAAAAQNGFNCTRNNLKQEKGFLAGVNHMMIFRTVSTGDCLEVKIECGAEISSLSVITGQIFYKQDLVAEAAITVWHG
jgi:predicted hotdog family 3-hydroxylacyl-ACP dehydratase